MANIQTRTTADNRVMYTARIRIKGFPQQTATFSRLTQVIFYGAGRIIR